MAESATDLTPQIKRYQTLSMVCAALLALQAIGLLVGAGIALSAVGDPKEMVAAGEQAVADTYPGFKAEVIARVEANSPEFADYLGESAVASIPDLRAWLASLAEQKIDAGTEKAMDLATEKFEAFVLENRPLFQKAFTGLDQAPDEAEELVLSLETKYEETFGADAEAQAEATLEAVKRLNARLEKLSDGGALKPQDLIERRIIRIVRAMAQGQPEA